MRRFRQVRHPVLVLFLILELVADPERPVGDTSPGPPEIGAGAILSMDSSKEIEVTTSESVALSTKLQGHIRDVRLG